MISERSARRGFSLVEALVCLALSLCLLWGVLPRYFHYQRRKNLDLAVSVVRQALTLARHDAIRGRRPRRVEFERESRSLVVMTAEGDMVPGGSTTLPPGIEFAEITESLQPLVFRPDGSLAGVSGSITLRDKHGGRTRKLIVYALTGRVRPDGPPP